MGTLKGEDVKLKVKKNNHLRNSFICLVLFLILLILMYNQFTYLGDVIFWWIFILPIFGIIEAILGIGKKKMGITYS